MSFKKENKVVDIFTKLSKSERKEALPLLINWLENSDELHVFVNLMDSHLSQPTTDITDQQGENNICGKVKIIKHREDFEKQVKSIEKAGQLGKRGIKLGEKSEGESVGQEDEDMEVGIINKVDLDNKECDTSCEEESAKVVLGEDRENKEAQVKEINVEDAEISRECDVDREGLKDRLLQTLDNINETVENVRNREEGNIGAEGNKKLDDAEGKVEGMDGKELEDRIENKENLQIRATKIYTVENEVTQLRQNRCGSCEGCLRANCRKCIFCKDMKKYGGREKKKKACQMRQCEHTNWKGKLDNEGVDTIHDINEDTKSEAISVVEDKCIDHVIGDADIKILKGKVPELQKKGKSMTPALSQEGYDGDIRNSAHFQTNRRKGCVENEDGNKIKKMKLRNNQDKDKDNYFKEQRSKLRRDAKNIIPMEENIESNMVIPPDKISQFPHPPIPDQEIDKTQRAEELQCHWIWMEKCKYLRTYTKLSPKHPHIYIKCESLGLAFSLNYPEQQLSSLNNKDFGGHMPYQATLRTMEGSVTLCGDELASTHIIPTNPMDIQIIVKVPKTP